MYKRQIYGGGSIKKNGIYSQVMRLLKDNGKVVVEAVSYTHLDVYKRQNRHSTVFHAVPLTSKIHKKTYLPTHIFISSFKAVGLRTTSIAQCEQLCDVKDTDLIEKIGKVRDVYKRQDRTVGK